MGGFRPLAGCGLFRAAGYQNIIDNLKGFRPLAGCGLFPLSCQPVSADPGFPSPCGVWVVSATGYQGAASATVSVPLRGVGCFDIVCYFHNLKLFPSPCGVWVVSGEQNSQAAEMEVSVPLRGVGCFCILRGRYDDFGFPSPCGVWVVSTPSRK